MKKSIKLVISTLCLTVFLISFSAVHAAAYPGPCHSPKPSVICPLIIHFFYLCGSRFAPYRYVHALCSLIISTIGDFPMFLYY